MAVERWRKIVESGDFDRLADVYAPQVFFEANLPTWRFQRQGRDAVVGQFHDWYGHKGAPRFVGWVERPTDTGTVVELEQLTGSGEDELYYRYVNVFVVEDDMVSEHVIYCPGPWDKPARARWEAEETLIRP